MLSVYFVKEYIATLLASCANGGSEASILYSHILRILELSSFWTDVDKADQMHRA